MDFSQIANTYTYTGSMDNSLQQNTLCHSTPFGRIEVPHCNPNGKQRQAKRTEKMQLITDEQQTSTSACELSLNSDNRQKTRSRKTQSAQSSSLSEATKEPKKRGPKKKPLTKEREVRLKHRRVRANTRERSRMHGLNHALELLRTHVPTFSSTQRLSKIETLRMAKNYIRSLSELLTRPEPPAPLELACMLTEGLSQNTSNLVATTLQVNPRALIQLQRRPMASQNDSSIWPTNQLEAPMTTCPMTSGWLDSNSDSTYSPDVLTTLPASQSPAQMSFEGCTKIQTDTTTESSQLRFNTNSMHTSAHQSDHYYMPNYPQMSTTPYLSRPLYENHSPQEAINHPSMTQSTVTDSLGPSNYTNFSTLPVRYPNNNIPSADSLATTNASLFQQPTMMTMNYPHQGQFPFPNYLSNTP